MTIQPQRFFGGLGAAFAVLLAIALIDAGPLSQHAAQQANVVDATRTAQDTPVEPSTQDTAAQTSGSASVIASSTAAPEREVAPSREVVAPEAAPASSAPNEFGVSLGERAQLLDLHNAARAKKDVPPVTWSADIAASAEAWAKVLKGQGCTLEHSGNDEFGENLYYGMRPTGQVTVAEVVGAFTAEETDYDPVTNTCDAGAECGHYTQVMWEDTTKIGCARAICAAPGARKEVWVCQYGPHGNVRGERPYSL